MTCNVSSVPLTPLLTDEKNPNGRSVAQNDTFWSQFEMKRKESCFLKVILTVIKVWPSVNVSL